MSFFDRGGVVVATGLVLNLMASCGAAQPAKPSVRAEPASGSGQRSAQRDARPTTKSQTGASQTACALLAKPTILLEADGAVLKRWRVVDDPVFWRAIMPKNRGFSAYTSKLKSAGATQAHPPRIARTYKNERERLGWEKEYRNESRVYAGVGKIRPIHCLEALMFAQQNDRYPQLSHPTEFVVAVLRKRIDGRDWLTLYFGAGAQLFPPKTVYGFDQARADVKRGWTFLVALHNHTIRRQGKRLLLGMPVPSTNDVQLMTGLVQEAGLQAIWVTNGRYTGVVPAGNLRQLEQP